MPGNGRCPAPADPHREFPGKFESANLSRENLSREIGRKTRRFSYPASGEGLTTGIYPPTPTIMALVLHIFWGGTHRSAL